MRALVVILVIASVAMAQPPAWNDETFDESLDRRMDWYPCIPLSVTSVLTLATFALKIGNSSFCMSARMQHSFCRFCRLDLRVAPYHPLWQQSTPQIVFVENAQKRLSRLVDPGKPRDGMSLRIARKTVRDVIWAKTGGTGWCDTGASA